MRFQIAVIFSLFLASSFAMVETRYGFQTSGFQPIEKYLAMEPEDLDKFSVANATLFTLGFFDGLNTVLGLQPFSPCVISGYEIVEEVKLSIQLIATKKFNNIVQGLTLLGEALQGIAPAIQNCQGAEDDVKILFSALRILKHPQVLITDAENILINGARVDQEIHAAINAEKAGDYLDFGSAIGQIFGLASTRNPQL